MNLKIYVKRDLLKNKKINLKNIFIPNKKVKFVLKLLYEH